MLSQSLKLIHAKIITPKVPYKTKHNEWGEKWKNELTKTNVLEKNFKEKIVYTYEKNFREENILAWK